MQRRAALGTLAALSAAVAVPARGAASGGYPQDTVTIVVAFGPGGSTDYLARLLAAELNLHHDGRFIVENKVGAGGAIGTRAVSVAKPDGRTLLYTTATPFSVNPHVYRTLPYDPDRGFAPVALTVQLPLVVVTGTPLGLRSLGELIEHLRRNEGASSFSSYGNGTASHIGGALFTRQIGAPRVLHVPYKDAQALQDLAEGRNAFHIDGWSTVAPWIASGKLVPLALCGREPLTELPDVPTVASVIREDFDLSTWHGLFAPAETPAEILDLLNREVLAALARDSVGRAVAAQGFKRYQPMSRKAFEAFLVADRARWKRFVEIAGVERV